MLNTVETPHLTKSPRRALSSVTASATFWWAASLLTVAVICVIRVVRAPRFFFWDDSQLGAYGQWYGLGDRLLNGDLSLLSPGSWQGGNYLAEGQWGIFNPLTWLIAIGTHAVDNALIYTTIVKVVLLLLLATGAFLLARSYGAAPWWAALAGVIAATGGQTIFMDAPSWVTGLQNIAMFALSWWALRRHLDGKMGPWLYILFAYLLVTAGYVFGVIELAVLLLAIVVERAIVRDWVNVTRVLLVGVYTALVAVLIYLPGLLTSPVTARASADILNDQFLNMDLGDLATSVITTATSSVRGYWGDLVPVPLQYVSWLIPLLVLCGSWRRSLASLKIPAIMLVFSVALVVGPSVIGPLRYPARMMPYVVLAVAVIIAVVASNGMPRRVDPRRAWIAVGLTVVSGWLAWAAQPASWKWVLLATVLQGAVFLLLAARGRLGVLVSSGPRKAGVLLVASLLVMVPQIVKYPTSPLGNFNVPSSVSTMRDVAADWDPGIFTVGDVYSLQFGAPGSYEESLLANLWYVTGKEAASVYTVLPFKAFSEKLCVDLRGWTCPDAFDALFEETDGQTLADDMSLNTVVVVKGDGLERIGSAPAGWSVEDREFTWLLTRDEPVDRAGGIARTSGDAEVSLVSRDDMSVTVHVDSVGERGGSVVFSRLAWPGYSANGGQIADPDLGFLLTLDLSKEDAGKDITVTFRPPGWNLELASAGGAVLAAIAAGVIWFRRRRA
ncbi:hypothetical protein [Microbacterium sp. Ag1]|uniref:hypothetical protein n=1 Tax=Microbacterium sp. Ag1 TaxID=1643443 RepID=UPI0006296316|nr:hypothetical protein [Microbacterium sp. Ag1]KKX96243.1 hypothetical protein AAY78_17260 [Microbacterium sp. Ag1]